MASNGSFLVPPSSQGERDPYSLAPSTQPDDLLQIADPVNAIEANALVASVFQQDIANMKFEETTMELDFLKDEPVDFVDVKTPLTETSVWQNSQELINLLLLEDDNRSLSFPGVRLDDDLYMLSNRESQPYIFPRSNSARIADTMPEPSRDMYRWRGDLGLLDRIAYNSPNIIPRNWAMTSMDAARIEQYNQNAQLRIESEPTNLIAEQPYPLAGQQAHEASDTQSASAQSTQRLRDSVPVQSQEKKKKRTRTDLKKREAGNNRYGRRGNSRCLICRKRRIKCEYDSESPPCKFCRSRGINNCTKLSSREFASRSKTRFPKKPPIPDSIQADLNFVVSHGSGGQSPMGSLVQGIGVPDEFWMPNETYAGSDKRALQWAVLAWAARQYPPQVVSKSVLTYLAEAARCIRFCLSDGFFYESGVFASNLMGWVSYSTCSEEFGSRAHFKGSVAMLSCLLDLASPTNAVSSNIMVFGPFIFDCANAWAVRNGGVPHRSTSFEQRVAYFDELSTGPKADTWYSGILEAANSTIGNLLEISLSCVCQLARRETELDIARDPVNDVLQYVRAELGDSDFHAALLRIHSSFQGENKDHGTVEGQLITRLFHRLRAVLVLHSILDSDSILEGIASERSIMFGIGLIDACRTHAIRRDGPIEDYYLISWHNYSLLLLGGMTLSQQNSPDLCAWVVDELEFIGKERAATSLQGYWNERDIEVLSQILDFAQFPDPMPEDPSPN